MEFIIRIIFWTLAPYGLFEIIKKLSEEYECLEAVNWKDCKEIMDSVDES